MNDVLLFGLGALVLAVTVAAVALLWTAARAENRW